MLKYSPELRAFIQQLRGESLPQQKSASDRIHVPEVLASLAASESREDSAVRRTVLEILCRKIEVSKTVCESYTPDWKRIDGAPTLPLGMWPRMIAVLLHHSCLVESANSDHQGLSWKYLNAALTALDLASDMVPSAPRVDELRTISIHILRALFGGGER